MASNERAITLARLAATAARALGKRHDPTHGLSYYEYQSRGQGRLQITCHSGWSEHDCGRVLCVISGTGVVLRVYGGQVSHYMPGPWEQAVEHLAALAGDVRRRQLASVTGQPARGRV